MMTDLLIVDTSDKVIGHGEKLILHVNGILHRAFSVFIFARNGKQLLLQRRAMHKYHSGGKWSNACCSHPRQNPLKVSELNQRLLEELRFNPQCQSICDIGKEPEGSYVFCGKLRYQAWFNALSEHEIDHVFVLFVNEPDELCIKPNPDEVSATQLVTLPELVTWVDDEPGNFSAWFLPTFLLAYRAIYAECLRCSIPAITPAKLICLLRHKVSDNIQVDEII